MREVRLSAWQCWKRAQVDVRVRDGLAADYAGWQARAAAEVPDAWPVPIERLVGVQLGAVLGAAAHLAGAADIPAGRAIR